MARIAALTLLIALGATLRFEAMADSSACAPTACALEVTP